MGNEKKIIWKRWYMWLFTYPIGLFIILAIVIPNQDYEMGMKAYNENDYVEAYSRLSVVKSDDEGYKQAQKLLPDLKIKADSVNAYLAKVDAEKQANEAKSDAEKQAEKIKQDNANARQAKIDKLFEAENGVPENMMLRINMDLKNPDPFELIEKKVSDVNFDKNMILVNIRFRVKLTNGNWKELGAKAYMTLDGKIDTFTLL